MSTLGGGARVPYLDGIRGVAIAAVICVHVVGPYLPGLDGGYVGVDLFFVLSGFVITSILLTSHRSYRSFLRGRVLRLYPALLGMLVVGSLLAVLIPRNGLEDAEIWQSAGVAGLQISSFWRALDISTMTPVGITWSLSVEWVFYLLWPLVVIFLKNRGRAESAWLLTLAASIACYAFGICLPPEWFYYGPVAHFGQLLLGSAVAMWASFGRAGVAPRMSMSARVSGAVGILTSVLVVGWTVAGQSELSGSYRLVVCPLITVSAALLIVTAYLHPAGPVVRWLSWRPLAKLGLISYSLYLWHSVPFDALGGDAFGLPRIVRAGLAAMLVVVLTAASYLLLERPRMQSRSAALPNTSTI